MKKSTPLRGLISGLLALVAGIPSTFGAIVTTPAGLSVGDTYRLVFVTDGTTIATSPDIGFYNTFVTNQANNSSELAALGTIWKAIGTTETVSASSNIGGITVPIFGLDGLKIADNSADLWDGSLDSGISITQSGVDFTGGLVRSGSVSNGSIFSANFLGQPFFLPVAEGIAGNTTGLWINNATAGTGKNTPRPLYAISGDLVVTPEPNSTILLVLGLGAAAARRRRRS